MFGFHENLPEEENIDDKSTFSEKVEDSVDENFDKICASIVVTGEILSILTGTGISEYPIEEDPIPIVEEISVEENFGDNISAMFETFDNFDDMVQDLSDDHDISLSTEVPYSDEPY